MEVAFMAGMAIGVVIILLICLGSYVLDSVLKMKLFAKFGTCKPVMAWVPFYSSYLLGKTCTGRNGSQMGLFGVVLPNSVWEFGWIFNLAITIVGNLLRITTITYPLSVFVNIAYYAFIWSFFYSRMEGQPEENVRVISIVSGIIGVVALIKILSAPNTPVYSLENDMYPMETVGAGQAQAQADGFGDFGDFSE